MNTIERIRSSQPAERGSPSVLDGRQYIGGLLSDRKSSIEEAREHPEKIAACENVLDGPACIAGLPH